MGHVMGHLVVPDLPPTGCQPPQRSRYGEQPDPAERGNPPRSSDAFPKGQRPPFPVRLPAQGIEGEQPAPEQVRGDERPTGTGSTPPYPATHRPEHERGHEELA